MANAEAIKTDNGNRHNDVSADLISHAKVLLPHKWTILGIAFVAALAALILAFVLEPVYRATATIQIEPKESKILNIDNIYESNSDTIGYFATQFQVLASRTLAEKAVAKIDWSKYPEFIPKDDEKNEGGWLSYLPFLGTKEDEDAEKSPKSDEEMRQKKLVDAFQEHTNIQPVAGTLLVQVHFLSKYPELSKDAANLISNAYIESGFEAKLETAQRAADFMQGRMKEIRGSLAQSQSELQDYRENESIVNIGGGRGIVEQEIKDNMQGLREVQRTKTELDNTYRQIQRSGNKLEALSEIPALHASEVVQDTKSAYVLAQQDLKELATRYGPKHPKMIAARAAVAETARTYLAQLLNAAQGVRTKYELARENVDAFTKRISENKADLQKVDRKESQLQLLERDTSTNRDLYDSILTQFKETNAEGDFKSLRAQIVDPALLPELPYKPRKTRMVAFAGLGGFFLGICLVLVREQLDDSIKNAQGFEELTGIPVLANVPLIENKKKHSVALQILNEPGSEFSESIRTARTGIVLSDLDKSKKNLLVTSSLPEEGKSSIAASLALSFGQIERVLLVEADLRRPTLSRYLGLEEKLRGLTELMAGTAESSQVLHKIAENVDFLAVGAIPPNPAELLSTKRFGEVIDTLAANYDRVIFDSAPCQPISDTMLLASHSDTALFVVQYDKTGRNAINVALRRLQQANIPITGAVLNLYEHEGSYSDSYYSYYRTA